jgi:hypothetical protein
MYRSQIVDVFLAAYVAADREGTAGIGSAFHVGDGVFVIKRTPALAGVYV